MFITNLDQEPYLLLFIMQLLFLNFLQTPHILALSITLLTFLITIVLVLRWRIRFLTSVLILVAGLAISLVINYYQELRSSFQRSSTSSDVSIDNQEKFKQQMQQAIEDLWTELETEKKQLKNVMYQVQEILDSVNTEKVKLQNFIEETRERFQSQTTTDKTSTQANSIDQTSKDQLSTNPNSG